MVKRCYYEVLDVTSDATDREVKKAYRALALKWHPDKNLDNTVEAARQFMLVQQAFDVLSDPQERAFYDNNRDNILRGKNSGYVDDCVDVFNYFSTSCYHGYGDDEMSFYNVYREVFKTLAAEESEFAAENGRTPPEFGDAASSYEDVNAFYGYWQAFCTRKTYSWLDQYDIQDGENRRIVRLMKQENKRERDKARKERNEQVRALVDFVRKRDKRVQAQAEFLKKKNEENKKKAEDHRRRALEKNRRDLESLKEAEWSKFSNMEDELRRIESTMASEFNDHDDSEESEYDELYCIACNKAFKTEKAFENHEKSKKHRENVSQMKEEVSAEDDLYHLITSADCDDGLEDSKEPEEVEGDSLACSASHENVASTETFVEHSNVPEDDEILEETIEEQDSEDEANLKSEIPVEPSVPREEKFKKKKKQKNKKKKNVQPVSSEESELEGEIDLHEVAGSKKQKRKVEREKILNNTEKKLSPRLVRKIKQYIAASKPPPPEPKYMCDLIDFTGIEHRCEYCNSSFVSNNRLQKHLHTTGHTSPLIPPSPPKEISSKNSRNSKSRKQSNRR